MIPPPLLDLNISTHAPRAGSDVCGGPWTLLFMSFQPTLPVRGATISTGGSTDPEGFQPTLPVRGATGIMAGDAFSSNISTHAPRAGSDTIGLPFRVAVLYISTHAPRAGSDFQFVNSAAEKHIFQPTLPVRGATTQSSTVHDTSTDFNPRSPCGERLR